MNEFEWRRQMRELRQPQAPRRDLWASIDAALDDAVPGSTNVPAPRATRRRHWLLASGIAASMLLAGGIGWHWLQMSAATPLASHATNPTTWKPSDPRLAGAAIELDAARMELQLAIRQAPDSAALQRLLDRTEVQQTQLRQLARQAG
jgi:hypothetical protein